jgi:hypothetical protein
MKAAIIYYTSNRESPEFEKKIQGDLLAKSAGLPIISVSQKPMDFGKNICVGNVDTSGFNMCRQVQIACENTDADYVISAEADCLYSPDYFDFVPPKLDVCYRNTNIYILKYKRDFFNKKTMSTFSQVIGREFYLKRLSELFEGAPQWSTKEKNFPKERGKKIFDNYEYFETKFACISFKTGKGMRQHTTTFEEEFKELPYWGDVISFRNKYL